MPELIDVAPRFHYIGILLVCLLLTAPLEFVIGARVYRRPRRLAIALAAAVPFIAWDVAATAAGHWWFAEDYLLGINVGNLPIEEWGFFAVIPLCGLLTFEAVTTLWAKADER